MRKSRFTEAQIIGMIKEQGAGLPTSELCRKHGLSPATFYKRKADMVALYTVWYNFVRQHKTLRCSPAMVAGLSETLWSMEDVVKLIDVQAANPARPNVYKTSNSN